MNIYFNYNAVFSHFSDETGNHVKNNRDRSPGGDPVIAAQENDPVVCRSWLFCIVSNIFNNKISNLGYILLVLSPINVN